MSLLAAVLGRAGGTEIKSETFLNLWFPCHISPVLLVLPCSTEQLLPQVSLSLLVSEAPRDRLLSHAHIFWEFLLRDRLLCSRQRLHLLGAWENVPNFQWSTSSYRKRSRHSEPGAQPRSCILVSRETALCSWS